MGLAEYRRKRDFKKTREPRARVASNQATSSEDPIFVVQEHHASHLHYDFRLEVGGVLKSWAVPKGPSLDPAVKRLAVEVEDHPLEYAKFSGEIPKGEYGGGTVYTWDTGSFRPAGNPGAAIRKGRLEFRLEGEKLRGAWILVRTRRTSGKPQWLLIKRHDEFASDAPLVPVAGAGTPVRKKPEPGKERAPNRAKEPPANGTRSRPGKKTTKAVSKSGGEEVPKFVRPQLAQLSAEPPTGAGWVHEMKYDGYRILARIVGKKVILRTRNELDWTKKYPSVAKELAKLKKHEALLDGEIVWVNEDGTYDFQHLQNATSGEKIPGALGYFVFDLLFLDGEDLRSLPLLERKKRLATLLAPLRGGPVVASGHFEDGAEDFLKAACEAKLEGIISKRADGAYVSGRGNDWVKTKCSRRQEFVIGGYSTERGSRVGFGALLLGVAEAGELRYVGKVGTGFSQRSLLDLKKRLKKLARKQSPFAKKSPGGKGLHWVKPELVAEIAFANWTKDQMLRVPVFHGLRGDKAAGDVVHEKPKPAPRAPKKNSRRADPGSEESVVLTHPEKVLFPAEKITKEKVLAYYAEVSPLLLPLIDGRPISLLRCPSGVKRSCFMQKHLTEALSPGLAPVAAEEKDGAADYVRVSSAAGLGALVQKNVIEVHVRGSREGSLDRPDMLVMDFDPGPGVSFKRVVKAALALREMLRQLKLESFVKVTGGKGLHVHVPLAPHHDWGEIKNFAHALARALIAREPKEFTSQMAKSARQGKIFVDYLRNAEGQTAVAPYSLRAREKSSVALPVEWEELARLRAADQFTLPLALKKIRNRKRDPWEAMNGLAQEIALLRAAA